MTHDPATLTPLQRAFLALEQAQARVARLEQAAREPIAVIGLGCRVPGGGDDPARFWALMRDGVDAIGPVPADRWDAEALFDPDPARPGRIATRAGGFLDRVDRFDPTFFGIAPREAQGMDPQQRLLLEVAWEALEHAGQAADRLEGSQTGVYVGLCSSDYAYMQLMTHDSGRLDAHFTSGIAHSIASGRLSYLLGLQGPSLTIDTACSSSLVAVHLACQALRAGEVRMALAGGVNLILSPELFIALSHARMLAPDGRCKTFDASADGFARGEGCGVVVLKRLRDAVQDGDRILAVIRGSAVNQDGPSSGLTAPNGSAQEAVLREALARAGVTPAEIGVIEAHGTGTSLGDPIEVQALRTVLGGDRDPAHPLWIGSVKTNVGHLEAAAGVTGLIKLVLALQQRTIPAHLHFRTPSPHIAWDASIRVPVETTSWEPIGGRRLGGVSAFGFSGTNAHVIVEEAPEPAARESAPGPWILTLSTRQDAALAPLAGRYADALAGHTDDDVADVCYTANVGRAHLPCRATIAAPAIEVLRDRLRMLSRGETGEGMATARVDRDPPTIAFLFTGQGAQYAGMSRRLYETTPVFRAALDRCAELLRPALDRPLLDVLFAAPGASSPLDETAWTQPALFAVEYALAELWRSWGIVPTVVMGHSVGEYVAACIAGVFSLEDGLALIAERGRLMQSLPAGGAMAAVRAAEAVVRPGLSRYPRVAIAAVNGPDQTVISGPAADVDAIVAALAGEGITARRLPVSHAFHSPLVEPVLDAFERAASRVTFARPRLRIVSNVSGTLADPDMLPRPEYWRRHLREPVRFADGLRALAAIGPGCVVEVGPHPTLLPFARTVIDRAGAVFVSSLRQGRDDRAALLEAAGALHLAGAPVNWRATDPRTRARIVDLPTYPFQRERCWFPSTTGAGPAHTGRATGHAWLGTRLRSSGSDTIFEAAITADAPGYLRDHRVQGRVVVPATAYLEALDAVGRHLLPGAIVAVDDVAIEQAMLLEDEGGPARIVQTVATRHGAGDAWAVTISSLDDGDGSTDGSDTWRRHATAVVRSGEAVSPAVSIEQAREACGEIVDVDAFYRDFEGRGLDFGDAFRSVRQIWRGKGQAIGEIELAPALAADSSSPGTHPVLLDGCLQVAAAAIDAEGGRLWLPIGVGRCTLLATAPVTRVWSHVSVSPTAGEGRRAHVSVFDETGRAIAEMRDVQLRPVSREAIGRQADAWLDTVCYEVAWHPAPARRTSAPVAELVARAHAISGSLRDAAHLDAYDVFQPKLEALCVAYVIEVLTRLGWTPATGERIACDALARRLGVLDRHQRLFARLLAILAEDGFLAIDREIVTVTRPLTAAPASAQLAILRRDHPIAGVELDLTARVAGAGAEALRGDVDPMQMLFPGGSLDTAEQLYRDTPTARFYNGLLAEVLAAAVALRPGTTTRILEVGAGTGGTTAHVLPVLPETGVEYTFTDVGPLFVSRAQARFGAHAGTRFRTFDLARAPEAQGFEPGTFDIVIASNVVHATADLRQSIAALRRLIAPGGLFVMLEVTAPQRWFDLTVGFTDGWWAFTDHDLRPAYPTISRDAWLALLGDGGFAEVEALPVSASARGTLALQSLFVCRASERPAHATSRQWLVFTDAGTVGTAVCGTLRERGDDCATVRPGQAFAVDEDAYTIDPADPEHYRRLLAHLRAAGRSPQGIVHAWSLDHVHAAALSVSAIDEAQTTGGLSVLRLVQALVDAGDGGWRAVGGEHGDARVWAITRGAQRAHDGDRHVDPVQATTWGLGRTVSLEHPELRLVCVDLDPDASTDDAGALLAELDEPFEETQVAWHGGARRAARLLSIRPHRDTDDQGVMLPVGGYRLVPHGGAIDGLAVDPDQPRLPAPGEIQIAVEATGLNFKDVLNVLGMYPGDPGPLGGECAGRVAALGDGVTGVQVGDAVMAVGHGCFASHVTTPAALVQRIPDGVGAEEAAAFPIAYITAEYCLRHLAGLKAGDTVLVHAAAGGVGLAAVHLAQQAGAVVFATAGSPAKRARLLSLGVAGVFDSRSAAFADEILAATGGRGVDVVLNSLSGDAIEASFRATAHGGRFVEIGKRGIKSPAWVEALGRAIAYWVVDWGTVADRDPALIGTLFARLAEAWRAGRLPSLPRHVFAIGDAARAFRFMAQARHIGKVVVRHGRRSTPRVRRDGTYLVTGGASGLGLVVARDLATRGAGRIVIVGRRGATDGAVPAIEDMRALGTDVVVEALDVSDETAMSALIARLRRTGPPLRGVIHSAGVLADAAVIHQDAASFRAALAPKLIGGWLLHTLTAVDPIDMFVLFSSAASVLGAPGQANHAAASAALDALAHERRANGQPAISIDWGAWAGVGAAVDRGATTRLEAQGIGALSTSQGLRALDVLIETGPAQVVVIAIDWPRYLERSRAGRLPIFREIVAATAPVAAPVVPAASGAPRERVIDRIAAAETGRRRSIVAAFVRESALRALGLDPSRPVDPRTPLGELGLDSLLAVELRNTLGSALERSLPASLLFDYPSLDSLTDYLVTEVLAIEPKVAPAAVVEAPAPDLLASIADLSDDEVERQLAARARPRT